MERGLVWARCEGGRKVSLDNSGTCSCIHNLGGVGWCKLDHASNSQVCLIDGRIAVPCGGLAAWSKPCIVRFPAAAELVRGISVWTKRLEECTDYAKSGKYYVHIFWPLRYNITPIWSSPLL